MQNCLPFYKEYPAREKPIDGATAKDLSLEIKKYNFISQHHKLIYIEIIICVSIIIFF